MMNTDPQPTAKLRSSLRQPSRANISVPGLILCAVALPVLIWRASVLACFAPCPIVSGLECPAKDHARLAFLRKMAWEGRERCEVWMVDLATQRQRRVSAADEIVEGHLAASGRAELLAWWSLLKDSEQRPLHSLRVCSAFDGSPPQTIHEDYGISPEPVAFTADGRSIVFGRSQGEFGGDTEVTDWGLWRIGIDGRGLEQLTTGFDRKGASRHPTVSPDGSRIAFHGYFWEEASALCVVNSSGDDPKTLPIAMRGFAWYPDSQSLIVAQSGLYDEPWSSRLVRYDIDSGRVTPLTCYEHDRADHSPAFSPDGTKLAYWRSRYTEKNQDCLIVADLNALHACPVVSDVDGGALGADLAWSRNSDQLFYAVRVFTSGNAGFEIWGVKADGADKHKVVDNGYSPVAFGSSEGAVECHGLR